ncbi:MAG: discoidin domain-containing protein, partial [Clostridiales bacterium]|nr:discoidin domain-containing protein [Clostridiales bacterium]
MYKNKLAAALLTFLFAVCEVFGAVPYAPPIVAAAGEITANPAWGGSAWVYDALRGVERKTFFSEKNNCEISYTISLPKEYRTNRTKRYPVIYVFSGAGGDDTAAKNPAAGLYDSGVSGSLPPMIMIGVHINGGYGFDEAYGNPPKYPATAFIEEFIPYIDANYRTIPHGFGRSLEGFSAGGMASGRFLTEYPDMFASIHAKAGAFRDYQGMREKGGKAIDNNNIEYFNQFDIFELTKKNYQKVIDNGVSILLDVGEADQTYSWQNVPWINLLEQLQVPFTLNVRPYWTHGSSYSSTDYNGWRYHAAAMKHDAGGGQYEHIYSMPPSAPPVPTPPASWDNARNAALGKAVTVSEGTGNASAITDGNTADTAWTSISTRENRWAEIDLGSEQTLTAWEVTSGLRISKFKLQYQSGGVWTDIDETYHQANPYYRTSGYFCRPINARYVRLLMSSNDVEQNGSYPAHTISLKEIRLFTDTPKPEGVPDSPYPPRLAEGRYNVLRGASMTRYGGFDPWEKFDNAVDGTSTALNRSTAGDTKNCWAEATMTREVSANAARLYTSDADFDPKILYRSDDNQYREIETTSSYTMVNGTMRRDDITFSQTVKSSGFRFSVNTGSGFSVYEFMVFEAGQTANTPPVISQVNIADGEVIPYGGNKR